MTTIALVGNPNSGKTTLFNKLTGSSQRVGNWPGVTVEKKTGKLKKHEDVHIVDLPGIYSLTPYSPEEVVTRDFLSEETPDMVINIVDASNLERNLYLTTQIMEMGVPVTIALNMMDIAKNRGIDIDAGKLGKELGCKVVPTCALKNEGIDEVVKAALDSVGERPSHLRFSDETEKCISEIEKHIEARNNVSTRWYAIKLIESDSLAQTVFENKIEEIAPYIQNLEKTLNDSGEAIIADERYNAIAKIVGAAKTDKGECKTTLTDKIDKYLTNKWLGLPIFAGILFVVYFFTVGNPEDAQWYNLGAYLTGMLNDFIGGPVYEGAVEWLTIANVDPVLIGLICDGIISGVGAVLGFVPQILILFLFLSILEDCGYMARVCFVMDRIFRRFNLSGKSFIPLLVGTGCSIPGIMATRTIENDCDRKLTAMTTSFIPCSAKLPIISAFAAYIFGGSPLIAVFSYFLGIFCVLLSGIILKKWRTFAGEPSVFIMELPPYHAPKVWNVIKTTLDRGWAFVKKAGTLILLATVVIWLLSNFNWSLQFTEDINDSMLASIGNAICSIFVPLGFGDDWRFTVATITGLVAKEAVIDAFALLFEDGNFAGFITSAAALAFITFNLICAPCFAAIGAMKRELGAKGAGFAVLYQSLLAYALGSIVYTIASVAYGDPINAANIIVTAISAIILVYVLAVKDPFKIIHRGIPAEPEVI